MTDEQIAALSDETAEIKKKLARERHRALEELTKAKARVIRSAKLLVEADSHSLSICAHAELIRQVQSLFAAEMRAMTAGKRQPGPGLIPTPPKLTPSQEERILERLHGYCGRLEEFEGVLRDHGISPWPVTDARMRLYDLESEITAEARRVQHKPS